MIQFFFLHMLLVILGGAYLLSFISYTIYCLVGLRRKGETIGVAEVIAALVTAIFAAFIWYVFMPFKIYDAYKTKAYYTSLK